MQRMIPPPPLPPHASLQVLSPVMAFGGVGGTTLASGTTLDALQARKHNFTHHHHHPLPTTPAQRRSSKPLRAARRLSSGGASTPVRTRGIIEPPYRQPRR